MKRVIVVFLSVCFLFVMSFGHAENQGVDEAALEWTKQLEYEGNPNRVIICDEAGLLKEDEQMNILETMVSVSQYADAGFLTYPSGGSTQNSAEKAKEWGEKTFGQDAGFVVFIIDMTNRHLLIYASPSVSEMLTVGVLNSIADQVYRSASRGEYGECAVNTFDLVREYLVTEGLSQAEFVFRGKIKWGMSIEEVTALEGDAYSISKDNISTVVSYKDVDISNYKGHLWFCFMSDRLVGSVYTLLDPNQDMFNYLKKALKVVYGNESEADGKELTYLLRKPNGDEYSEDMFQDYSICKWELANGTVIYMYYRIHSNLEIYYFSPEYILWEPVEEVNTTGL